MRRAARTSCDGWLRTGDAGHRDAEGFFYADDRLKDMVISGGENAHPAEREKVLARCPAILEATAVGPADKRWDEVPIAYAVAGSGSRLRVACVMALLEERLARFTHPREIVFLDSLPRNRHGQGTEIRAARPRAYHEPV